MANTPDNGLLDADWAALSPEKKTELAKIIQQLDFAKLYQGGAPAATPEMQQGARDFSAIAAQGGLPQDQLTALSRFKMYQNLTGSDPGWQGPTQIPTGARQAEPKPLLDPNMPGAMTQAKTDAYQSQEQRYDSLAKPESKPLSIATSEQGSKPRAVEMQASVPESDEQAVGQSFLQMLMDLAKGKK